MDIEQQTSRRSRIAILWRGDATARRDATPQNNRFVRVFEALAACGIDACPVVYDESFADRVRDQLLTVDGVLVWVDRYIRARRARHSIRCCARSRQKAHG
jgi:hypothetical protein